MEKYDTTFFTPPAPATNMQVTILGASEDQYNFQAQLDSGADISCIPLSVCSERPKRTGRVRATSYDGSTRTHETWFVNMEIGGIEFQNIEMVVVQYKTGLIGRDILNLLTLSLNGPKLRWEITE